MNKRMWLACYTQQEIADEMGCDRTIVSDMSKKFVENGNLAENHKPAADHLNDCLPSQDAIK